MDGFAFIAEIIKAVAWPSAVIALVILLRKPIVELVPLMKKLKYKELELEFAQEIEELKSHVGNALTKRNGEPDLQTVSSKAMDLVSYSARAAIIEAWIELEAVAVEKASSFWNQAPSEAFRNDPKLGDYLHKCKVLDDKQVVIYKKLRKLRNKSAHSEDLNLSEKDARSYVNMASILIEKIKAG